MGSVIDAGKAGARSVSDSPSLTSNERPGLAPEAIRNDVQRGVSMLLPVGDITATLAAMPDDQVRAVAGYFDSERTCALSNIATLSKLLTVCDSGEIAGDVVSIGWLLHQLVTAAEFSGDVANNADCVMVLREQDREAKTLGYVNQGLAAGDEALQANRATSAAIARFKRSGDKRELATALASVQAAEKATDAGYTAMARLGVLTGCSK